MSGDPDIGALYKLSSSVLGHGYSTAKDTLTVKFRVNITPRKRGDPTGPDLTVVTLDQLGQVVIYWLPYQKNCVYLVLLSAMLVLT